MEIFVSKWRFNFRLRPGEPDDNEIQRYLEDDVNKGFDESALIRTLLLAGIRAKLGKKYEDWRDGNLEKG